MPFVEVPTDLCCPIDFDIFTDPVVTKSGDSYSRKSIERWFATCKEKGLPIRSPATNEILPSTDLIPNRELQSRVSLFRESLLTGAALQTAISTGDLKKLESSKIIQSELLCLFRTKMVTEGGENGAAVPALTLAMLHKQTDVVRWLLPYVDVNARSAGGKTAIHMATYNCVTTESTITLLLQAGADVNLAMPNGIAPLHSAAEHRPSLVPMLISNGADVNARTIGQQRTPLFFADSIETVKLLVAAGADLFAVDSSGWSNLFTVVDPTFFRQLVDLMTSIDETKVAAAFRSTKDASATILTEAVGSAHPASIRLARSIFPATINNGDLWHRFVRSDALHCDSAFKSRDRQRPVHLHPLTAVTDPYNGIAFDCSICLMLIESVESVYHCQSCGYDECGLCHRFETRKSSPDALACIPLLSENGGKLSINATDSDGQTPLIVLLKRIVKRAPVRTPNQKDQLTMLIRILVNLIQIGM
jgi:hypothetical protein